jgi:hypothetical protein
MDLNKNPTPGELVVLKELPPGLLTGLPAEDQEAIREIIGKTVRLVEYDDAGRAEVEFTDREGAVHSIWVEPRFIASR